MGNDLTISELLAETNEERLTERLDRGFLNGKEIDILTVGRFIVVKLCGVTGIKNMLFLH